MQDSEIAEAAVPLARSFSAASLPPSHSLASSGSSGLLSTTRKEPPAMFTSALPRTSKKKTRGLPDAEELKVLAGEAGVAVATVVVAVALHRLFAARELVVLTRTRHG